MSKDNLDKFIKENREAFDTETPSDKVWKGIDKRRGAPVMKQWFWQVAAVIFFCSSVFLLIDKQYSKPDVLAGTEKLSNDFGDVESFYFQVISEKRELIYDYDKAEKSIAVDFEQDLQKLDAMYEVLKEELKSNPSKKVADALILNLLVRIDVLNEKIEELEEIEEIGEEKEASNQDVSV